MLNSEMLIGIPREPNKQRPVVREFGGTGLNRVQQTTAAGILIAFTALICTVILQERDIRCNIFQNVLQQGIFLHGVSQDYETQNIFCMPSMGNGGHTKMALSSPSRPFSVVPLPMFPGPGPAQATAPVTDLSSLTSLPQQTDFQIPGPQLQP